LISVLERALDLGEFIPYNRSWDFVRSLEVVKHEIDALVKDGQAERAVRLYEIFLSGCYEKADEIDDSGGNLDMFFEDLFCAWINARQKAKYNPAETVQNILKWMDNDNYGFCFEIERNVVKVLNKESVKLFEAAIKSRFENAFASVDEKKCKRVSDYPWEVRKNVSILKVIYVESKNIAAYLALCERTGLTPKDCENIANLCKVKRKYQDALSWVEKGLKLEKKGNWGNQSSFGLTGLKQDLLNKLGRREDALDLAWTEFKKQIVAGRSLKKTDSFEKRALKRGKNLISFYKAGISISSISSSRVKLFSSPGSSSLTTLSSSLRFLSMRAAIFSSRVPSVTSLKTCTPRRCPMRCTRSVAWSSLAAFHQRS
jgi:tetratricopeptide (TPR) repeat protein